MTLYIFRRRLVQVQPRGIPSWERWLEQETVHHIHHTTQGRRRNMGRCWGVIQRVFQNGEPKKLSTKINRGHIHLLSIYNSMKKIHIILKIKKFWKI